MLEKFFIAIGRNSINSFKYLGGITFLTFQNLTNLFIPPFGFPLLISQINIIGIKSLPIVGVTALFTGMVLALQTSYGLIRFGAKLYVGYIVSYSLFRELGPVLTAIMVGGRVGSGITAEIGSMKVTEQIDAIRALGANPIKKLVIPRILAAIIVLPMLTVFADIMGILGGMIISSLQLKVGYYYYINSILEYIFLTDFLSGVFKSFFFGYIIGVVSCFQGFITEGSTEGVGKATTKTVVVTSISILVSDFFLTKLILFWETY